MSEVYLGNILSNLINLIPHDFQELKAFWGFGEELNLLRRSLDGISDLVERREANQQKWESLRVWLRKLKEVAYEADDLLSELAYETTRLQIQNKEVQSFYLNLKANTKKDEFGLKMALKLNQVAQSLQNFRCGAIVLKRTYYPNVDSIESQTRRDSNISMPVVGRQADVAKIVNMLMSLCYQQVTIVPVIGMAGIGKTDLAKLLSQEVRKRKLFDVNIWAYVSDDFNEPRIFGEMLNGLKTKGTTNMNEIRHQLGKQLAERDDDGDVIRCKMHDCVHDLALYLSRYEVLNAKSSGIDCTSRFQHLYADARFVTISMNFLKDRTKNLRTIILDGAPYQESWKLKSLRTLYMNGVDMEVLPSMDTMKHLRYLHISNSKIKRLSESIIKPYNLQTLNLTNFDMKDFPEFITMLPNLRTLIVSNSNIKELPKSIVKLHNLQTLNVSNSNMKELPESIDKLHNLQTLNLSDCNIKELPESIGQLHSLQTLNVSNSNIKELPETVLKLNNLQTLKFLRCKELTKLPRVKMHNLISLKHIAFSYDYQMPLGLGYLNCLETLTCFIVGPSWGGSIEQLECLNKLSGHLEIIRLEEVGDKKEAERANLQGKSKLQGLGFQWSYGADNRSSSDEELLEGLRPHQNIRRIKVKNYMGEKWPSWMLRMKSPSDTDSFAVLHNLVDLSLAECWKCVQLPCLGELPYLKFLKINYMGSVKCIDYEFYGINSKRSRSGLLRLFPALKSLSLSWMDNLTYWSSPSDGRVVVFPCLENLSIQSCAKLTGFPVSHSSALVNLEIKDCEEFRFIFRQQSFPSFTSLSIEGCPKLTYLRNWLPPSTCLKDISLRRCEWLTFIPEDLGKLSSLTSLDMYYCKRLRCFPEKILCKLTQLRKLCIGAFSQELDDFCYLNQIKDLRCLQELEIWGSDFFGREKSSLPHHLQHLTVLKSLKIIGFTRMEELPEWLTNLQSLQSLSLDYCRHLGGQSTATVILRLPNLTHLNITCCPILEKRKSKTWLYSLKTRKIEVEYSHVSKVRFRLGY
ncbi:disease resistance protein RGA2-like isoform X2 [Euphorbia lathyris]|uniref:disease resistance protein RGA2-like isoform X2 n=1 Tax=Euphorbia lathyris TaxID=212925 RepID=UPI003313C315